MKSVNPFELTLLIVVAFLIAWAVGRQLRNWKQAKKQNQALCQDRLSQHNQTSPPDVSLLILATRQLTDWEHLLKEMESTMEMTKARPEQIRYCRQQVNRFRKEVAWLRQQSN